MRAKIEFLKWRNRIDEITPEDHRIGLDLLLIDNPVFDFFSERVPFRMDMTVIIIVTKRWIRFRLDMCEYTVNAAGASISMCGQIYEPIECSSDIQAKTILMSQGFGESLFVNFGQVHPLQSSIYKSPIMAIDSECHPFMEYYDQLLRLAASRQSEFRLDAARHLTLAVFYGYSYQNHDIKEKCYSSKEDRYQKFLELVHKYHKTEHSIGFYAEHLFITPKYLSRLTQEVTGKTALDCIEEYVVSEAKAMLSASSMTIQEISYELNFPSQSAFGKYFKRVTGLSPKEYRNRLR